MNNSGLIYSFAVDEDNDLSTDEDRELFVKIENLKTGNATVNQITNDGQYTDADGNSHIGVAKSRPQLISSGDSVYLFWQRGTHDVAWLDLGCVIDSEDADGDTGLIVEEDSLSCNYVFYPTIGVKISPTYTSFKPFVDELGNLYVVWLQGMEENGVMKQELYAQALRTDKNPEGDTQCWSDPVRLTKTKVKADEYTIVSNDEPAIASLGSENLLVVCNRFATNATEGATANDLTMRGIRFDTIASVKAVDVETKNELPAPGEEIDLNVTVKNDGLKTANGFITVLMVIDNDNYEKVKDTTSIWTFLDSCDIVDIEMFYDQLAAGESTKITLNKDTCSPGYNIKMPDKLSESGYKVILMTAEMKDGNKFATTEPVGNPNDAVKLTYTNKNDVKGEVDGNKVFVYTYHIQVHKLDEKGKALSGAEFALYKTEADAKAEDKAIATGTSDKDGLVVFSNANNEEMLLQSGKYFVKETKAPTGYNRYTDVIPAEITVSYGDTLTNGTYIVNGPDLGFVSFDVKNSKTVLPQTGGQGNVIIYSVAVSLAVAGGVILLVLRRKKKSADKSA